MTDKCFPLRSINNRLIDDAILLHGSFLWLIVALTWCPYQSAASYHR
jgi:hypothetical protein